MLIIGEKTDTPYLSRTRRWVKWWQNSGFKNEQQMHLLTEEGVCDIILQFGAVF